MELLQTRKHSWIQYIDWTIHENIINIFNIYILYVYLYILYIEQKSLSQQPKTLSDLKERKSV